MNSWSVFPYQSFPNFTSQLPSNFPFLPVQPNPLALQYLQTLEKLRQYHAYNLQAFGAKKIETFQTDELLKFQNLPSVQTDVSPSEKTPQKIASPSKPQEAKEKDQASGLKGTITEIVIYFINEFGFPEKAEISKERSKYASNPVLLELFDSLEAKYLKAGKCREDMLRYAVRKALTSLRDAMRKKLNISAKAASLKLCERYFAENEQNGERESETEAENKQAAMKFMLPYKKNSKFSTPNMNFIKKIFGSKLFYQDYLQYLSNFDEILDFDNKKKIPKLVDFLVECVKTNTIYKLKTFKRLPWLNAWLQSTKVIAIELLQNGVSKDAEKKEGTTKRRKNMGIQKETPEK